MIPFSWTLDALISQKEQKEGNEKNLDLLKICYCIQDKVEADRFFITEKE